MKKLIPCVFIGCVLIGLMAVAPPASAIVNKSPDEIALTENDLPGWVLLWEETQDGVVSLVTSFKVSR